MSEIIDIVDENNQVIGSADRDEINEKKLRHRIVHVLVFNKAGEMAMQIRSLTKSFAPGYFSTSVGGYVLSGESYEDAAIRETKEELGLDLTPNDLKLLGESYYSEASGNKKFIKVFTAGPYEGPFPVYKEEVESVVFKPVSEISDLALTSDKFHPELAYILDKYYRS